MAEITPSRELLSSDEIIDRVLERYNVHPLATLETYKYFNQKGPEALAAKEVFVEASLQGHTPDAPEFFYPDINVDEMLRYRDELTQMLAELPTDEELNAKGKIVRENISNRLHEVGIMLLTKMQSELDPEDPRYEIISYQLGQNMREVYGQPEPEHFRGILGYRLSKLAKVEELDDVPSEVMQAWEFIKSSLPTDLPVEKPYLPKDETKKWYKAKLLERLRPAIDVVQKAIDEGEVIINEDGKLVASEIVKATKIALQAREAVGWTAEETNESNIDTTQSKKTIFIPSNREMTLEEFNGVVQSHEIDIHVMRRINGDASGEPVLGGTGANGYLAIEEGNGKANEGLLKDKISLEVSAFVHFLDGGLALGLDSEEGTARNFGQMSDLIWRMNFIKDYLAGANHGYEDERRQYIDKAVIRLNRIYRGTNGRVPGVVFTKDSLTYYLGQADLYRKWDADMEFSEEERTHEHNLERSAKINPIRPDHRELAAAHMDRVIK